MSDAAILTEFAVVAVDGEGVWVTDGNGNGWHVGTPRDSQFTQNKLARAYHTAFENE